MRESKLERATAKAITGEIGCAISRLNLDSLTFPKIIFYGPF